MAFFTCRHEKLMALTVTNPQLFLIHLAIMLNILTVLVWGCQRANRDFLVCSSCYVSAFAAMGKLCPPLIIALM